MNRRFGPQPDPNLRYTPRAGAYAVIRKGHGLLVTFQSRPYEEFQLPGGGIDPGESPVRALHREVFEETGYRVHSLRRLGMFHRFTFMPEYDLLAQKQCHVYIGEAGPRIGDPSEPFHQPVELSWDAAIEKLGISGDRYFCRLAKHFMG